MQPTLPQGGHLWCCSKHCGEIFQTWLFLLPEAQRLVWISYSGNERSIHFCGKKGVNNKISLAFWCVIHGPVCSHAVERLEPCAVSRSLLLLLRLEIYYQAYWSCIGCFNPNAKSPNVELTKTKKWMTTSRRKRCASLIVAPPSNGFT